MAKTMSDEREAAVRYCLNDSAAGRELTAELDAERAHAAELQQRLDAQPYESESELVRLLAAREAEVREAREALEHLLREWLAWRPGITGVARTRTEAILSRAPGGNEALRTLLGRMGRAAAFDAAMYAVGDGPAANAAVGRVDFTAIVARLLGPTGDGEQP